MNLEQRLGDTVSAPADETVWEIAGDSGYCYDKRYGWTVHCASGGNNNGITPSDTEYQWKWECTDGKFTFSGREKIP